MPALLVRSRDEQLHAHVLAPRPLADPRRLARERARSYGRRLGDAAGVDGLCEGRVLPCHIATVRQHHP
jgi:hypothetical protein